MARCGLNVPPGFTITTEVCQEFYRNGETLSPAISSATHAKTAAPYRSCCQTWFDRCPLANTHQLAPTTLHVARHAQSSSPQRTALTFAPLSILLTQTLQALRYLPLALPVLCQRADQRTPQPPASAAPHPIRNPRLSSSFLLLPPLPHPPPGAQLPDALMQDVRQAVAAVESDMGQRFGDAEAPLLFSVRSGAAVSAYPLGIRWPLPLLYVALLLCVQCRPRW